MAVRATNPGGAGRLAVWLPVAAVAGAIFAVSSVPGKHIPSLFPLQDVLFHATIYAILAWFFKRALRITYPQLAAATLVLVTVLCIAAYGASDELHQFFVPGRSCELSDLLVDIAGGVIGNLFYR